MSKSIYPKFCIVRNFKNAVPTEWNAVKELMQSAQVNNLCRQLASLDTTAADYAKQKTALKQKLPCITVHSCKFEDTTCRDDNNAYWNGMVCLDYDHLSAEAIEAFRSIAPCPGIVLAGKSCSGKGVWLLVEVPESDYQQMQLTVQTVHDEYSHQIRQKFGIDISDKLDKATDLARLRFLPSYDYIWWDRVEDFASEEEQLAGYMSMYGDVIAKCQQIDSNVPEGMRNNTYFKEMAQLARQYTTNTTVLLKYLPDLGLDEKERIGCLNWTKNITTEKPKTEPTPILNTKAQPIDTEALPFPYKAAPKLVQTLVKDLPA